jgi:hypothetical protein
VGWLGLGKVTIKRYYVHRNLLPSPAHRQFDAAASQEQEWSRTFAQGRPSNMMGGGEMKITELLLAELDLEAVGIRKTLESVPN